MLQLIVIDIVLVVVLDWMFLLRTCHVK